MSSETKKMTKSETNKLKKEKAKEKEKNNKDKTKANFKEKLIKQKFKPKLATEEQDSEPEDITPEYYNNSNFNLQIKKSLILNAGLGVFTLEKIPAKTYIGNYEGKKSRNKTGIYFFELTDKIGIDAIDYPRSYIAMINDSYKSEQKINCEFIVDEKKQKVELWSIVDIEIGSELFVSYGKDYWIE